MNKVLTRRALALGLLAVGGTSAAVAAPKKPKPDIDLMTLKEAK